MPTKKIKAQYELISAYDPAQPLSSLPFTTSETICKRISWLRYTSELSYPLIAARDEFWPIPAGTIQQIYETGNIPHKWKPRLRWRTDKPRNRCSINLDDPKSAAQTIIAHTDDHDFIYGLAVRLLVYCDYE